MFVCMSWSDSIGLSAGPVVGSEALRWLEALILCHVANIVRALRSLGGTVVMAEDFCHIHDTFLWRYLSCRSSWQS